MFPINQILRKVYLRNNSQFLRATINTIETLRGTKMKYYMFLQHGSIAEHLQTKPNWTTVAEVHRNKYPLICMRDEKIAEVVRASLTQSHGLAYGICDEWQEFNVVSVKDLSSDEIAMIQCYERESLPERGQMLREKATQIQTDIERNFKSNMPSLENAKPNQSALSKPISKAEIARRYFGNNSKKRFRDIDFKFPEGSLIKVQGRNKWQVNLEMVEIDIRKILENL